MNKKERTNENDVCIGTISSLLFISSGALALIVSSI